MKITNLIIAISATLILSSCSYNFGKKGNGNVTTEDRPISENFTEVSVSNGLNVYLSKGEENNISVEADENLQKYIKTDIKNGTLYIKTSTNIGWSNSKKIYVTYIDLKSIEASSGSSLLGNSTIKSEKLSLSCSSGAEMDVAVFSKELTAKTSSGADIKISGKASSFTAKASSGSELNAKELMTINCSADASSGAEISLNVKEKLIAKASSGSSVNYYGSPTTVQAHKSSSGSVRSK